MPSVKRGEIVVARGEGAYLWDERGRRYLDATGRPLVLQRRLRAHGDRRRRRRARCASCRRTPRSSSTRTVPRSTWPSASRRSRPSPNAEGLPHQRRVATRSTPRQARAALLAAHGEPPADRSSPAPRPTTGCTPTARASSASTSTRRAGARSSPDDGRVPTNDAEALEQVIAEHGRPDRRVLRRADRRRGRGDPAGRRLLGARAARLRGARRAVGRRRGHHRLRPHGAVFATERFGLRPDLMTSPRA